MERFLNQTADGTAGKFAKWYALAHAARCGPCRRFLDRLVALQAVLKQAREQSEPSPDTIERLLRDF